MGGSNQALVVSSSRASTSAVPVRDLTVPFPDYWADACRQLARRDRVMKRLIPLHAQTGLQSRGFCFKTLREHPQYKPWFEAQASAAHAQTGK